MSKRKEAENALRKWKYIVPWCRMMGSSQEYAALEVTRAMEDNAPDDAIASQTLSNGARIWRRLQECSTITRERVMAIRESMRWSDGQSEEEP